MQLQPAKPAVVRPAESLPQHLPELDGLRGIAIFAVLLYHYIGPQGGPPLVRIIGTLTQMGWMGVDLFFALSGFLITRILLQSRDHPKYYLNFYGRRALRIFPLYYLFLIAICVLVIFRAVPETQRNVLGLQGWLFTYTTNIGIALLGQHRFVSGDYRLLHFWSLAVEEQFYFFWPLVVRSFSRANLLRICVGLFAIAPLVRVAFFLAGVKSEANYVLTPCRMDALVFGAWLAAMFSQQGVSSRWERRLKGIVFAAISSLAVLTLCRGGYNHLDPVVQVVGYTPVALLSGGVVGWAIACSKSPVLKPLRSSWLAVLGKYSYGIYVFNFALAPLVERFFSTASLSVKVHSYLLAAAFHFALAVLISLVAAMLSYHLLEKHFLRLKRYFR